MSGRDRSAQVLEDELTLLMDRDEVSDSDIDRGLDLIEEVHSYLEKLDFDESSGCVAVLGTTGVGKSTVASFLFSEGKLLVHHENPYSRVLVAEKRLPGIDIHSGLSSTTLIPGVIMTNIEGMSVVVFDMPGSQDTRGPFAELVSHSIVKWMLAKHDQIRFLLVATPPQERPQATALAEMINRVYGGGLNAVLVCTKCSADFEPESITASEGIAPGKRDIPVFALPKPLKSHKEGFDYSAMHADVRCAIRSKLVCPVPPVNVFAGSVPESAQLLLLFFRKRTIEKSRDTLSEVFLEVYSHKDICSSFHHIENVLDALASQQTRTFNEIIGLLEQFLPQTTWPRSVKTVQKRLKMIEQWCGDAIVLCKEEWLTEKCRIVLKGVETELIALKERVCMYRRIQKSRRTKTLVLSACIYSCQEMISRSLWTGYIEARQRTSPPLF